VVLRRSLTAFAVTLLVACASVPVPKSELSAADLALRKAEQSDAAHYAPLDMRTARDKYQSATRAVDKGENLEARRLAEEASVDAELADLKARAARAKEAADEARASIQSLGSESGSAGGTR
jgi:hypothetical protein